MTMRTYPSHNSSDAFSFEDNFDIQLHRQWYLSNYRIPLCSIILYLIMIKLGPWYMKNQAPKNLKWQMFVWNTALALFSIVATKRMSLPVFEAVKTFGIHGSVCEHDLQQNKITYFWIHLFTLSKLAEFIDTVFLILRKRNIIFLHWYHHITVLMFTWYMFSTNAAPGVWFSLMNTFVHSAMYTYFALHGIGVKIPKYISVSITVLQIVQMFAGVFITAYVWFNMLAGNYCDISRAAAHFSVIIYGSYLLLFCKFFYSAYLGPRRTAVRPKAE